MERSTRLQLTREGLLSYLAKGFLPQADSDPLFEPNGRIFDPLEWIARLTSHIPVLQYCRGAHGNRRHNNGPFERLYREWLVLFPPHNPIASGSSRGAPTGRLPFVFTSEGFLI